MGTYQYPKFAYTGPADLMAGAPQRRPLIIVGAGPVGLAAAVDARLKGLDVLLFDEDDSVSTGSRASLPWLLKPMRLISARSGFSRNRRGRGFPG